MDYSSLTDDEIRARLTEAGVSVGPIVASTRPIYIKKLRKLAGEEVDSPSHSSDPLVVEEDDELPEVKAPRRLSPMKTARPMSARHRQPLYNQTAGDDGADVRQRKGKKLDVKMERQIEESSGGGIFGIIAKIIGFLILFAVLYFFISLYFSDSQPSNLISESG